MDDRTHDFRYRSPSERDPDCPSPRSVAFECGARVGRYVILHLLGSGGLSLIYAAFDPDLGRKVALKLMLPGAGQGPPDSSNPRASLLREAQAIARINHPNVVAVYEVGTHGDLVYLAEELVEGKDLTQWLRAERRSEREIREVFIQAGRGLAAAHAVSILHRDFKPANVLVGDDGRVRVVDFGLAHEEQGPSLSVEPADTAEILDGDAAPRETPPLPSGSASGSRPPPDPNRLFGTPAYMAPEHYKRERADARSDQFSFCVSLYRALYDEHPFMDRSDEELALAKYEGRVREPPRGSKVPAWLREVVLRGLLPDPEDRWPSMDTLLHALGDDPRVRRRRWLVWGAAFTSIALAAGTVERYVTLRTGRCRDVEQHLAGVWDPERKAAMRAAFERTHLPYAASVWTSVERLVDAYIRSWSGVHQEACEATWVHGEQSEDVFELRLECLKQRLGEVRALGELFGAADAKVVEQAVQVASGLSSIEVCSDVRALRMKHPPPQGQEAKKRLAQIEAELARIRALAAAGKYRESLPRAEAAVTQARALQHGPLLGQTLSQLGDLHVQSGDTAAAERTLEEAILRATAAGDEDTAVEAEMGLGWLLGVWKQNFAEGRRWTRLAAAGNAHLGDRLDRKAKLENALGVLHWQEGNYDEALAAFQRSLAAGQRAYGAAHPWVATSQANLGVLYMDRGDYQAALAALVRAREIQEKTLGQEHPLTSFSLSNLCEVHRNLGQLDVALAHGQTALALRERLLGQEHPAVAVTLDNLGLVHLDRGEYAVALRRLDRALSIREKHFGKDHPWVAATLDRMGEVYRASHQYPLALATYQRALDIRTRRLGPMHPDRAEVLSHLGLLQLAMGHAAEAHKLLTEAYAIQKDRRLAPQQLGKTRFGLAQALWMTGGDHQQARDLAEAALQDFGKLPAYRKERDEVAAWLVQHPSASLGAH